jgi:hypothetical protein
MYDIEQVCSSCKASVWCSGGECFEWQPGYGYLKRGLIRFSHFLGTNSNKLGLPSIRLQQLFCVLLCLLVITVLPSDAMYSKQVSRSLN